MRFPLPRKAFYSEEISLFSVVLFVCAWLFAGTFWSVLSSVRSVHISVPLVIACAVFYIAVSAPVVFSCFADLYRMKSRFKWLIIAEVSLFFAFVIAPPRNADAMRVWLAKVYDIWMNGRNYMRPYFHYFTPDAFTLFHLPLINLWDGQIFQLSIWISLCASLILVLKIGRTYGSENSAAMSLCLFLFNPLIILASTAVLSDMPVILAVAGMMYAMILYDQGQFHRPFLLLALFLAFGMNIKYNMLMFLPVLFFWMIRKTRADGIQWKSLPFVIILFALAFFPYALNYFNIGNPVWPSLIQWFPSNNVYLDEVGMMNAGSYLSGERNLLNFLHSFLNLFLMPEHINPLAMGMVLFVFTRFPGVNFLPAIFVVTYFFILWLMMPQFAESQKERYVLYLFPIIIPFGVSRIHDFLFLSPERRKKFFSALVAFISFIYLSFTAVYSYDAFRYIFTLDKKTWHRATWYYEDYEWMNRNILLDPSEKILVVVSNQQTYYLKKPYLNADCASALVDWRTLKDMDAIKKFLSAYRIRYIFADEDYLKSENETKSALEMMLNNGFTEAIRESKSPIYSSRLRNLFEEHRTILYRVVGI